MPHVTQWLVSMHADGPQSLDKDTLEDLVSRVFPTVQKILAGRFRGGRSFGEDLGDDLAQEAIARLLAGGHIRQDVIDAKTLTTFLCDKAVQWSRDRWRTRSGKRSGMPPRRGGSAVVVKEGEDSRIGHFDALSSEVRNGSPAEEDTELRQLLQEAVSLAIEDLSHLGPTSDRAARVLELRIRGLSRAQLAETFGVARATITVDLQKAEFCLLRRLGYPDEALIEVADDAAKWLQELGPVDRSESMK